MTRQGLTRRTLSRFARDAGAASAVEFALVILPFIYMLLGTVQVGVYYIAQTSLDAGVAKTADDLRTAFASSSVSSSDEPTGTDLTSKVVTYSGGVISNAVADIQPLSNLDSSAKSIDATNDNYDNSPTGHSDTLVLRAQAEVPMVVPFPSFTYVRSSAIVRKKGAG